MQTSIDRKVGQGRCFYLCFHSPSSPLGGLSPSLHNNARRVLYRTCAVDKADTGVKANDSFGRPPCQLLHGHMWNMDRVRVIIQHAHMTSRARLYARECVRECVVCVSMETSAAVTYVRVILRTVSMVLSRRALADLPAPPLPSPPPPHVAPPPVALARKGWRKRCTIPSD